MDGVREAVRAITPPRDAAVLGASRTRGEGQSECVALFVSGSVPGFGGLQVHG